jgi:hypothetical protein
LKRERERERKIGERDRERERERLEREREREREKERERKRKEKEKKDKTNLFNASSSDSYCLREKRVSTSLSVILFSKSEAVATEMGGVTPGNCDEAPCPPAEGAEGRW